MCLDDTLGPNCLSDGTDDMVLYVARLDVVRVSCYKRHVLAFLIFEANFPAVEKLRPGLYVGQLGILERSLELPANNVFETVVGDDVVVGALVLDRDGLLHQAALLELIAVDEGAAEASLLIGSKALGEVGIDLVHRVGIRGRVERGVLVFVLGVLQNFAGLRPGRSIALLSLSLGTARWV